MMANMQLPQLEAFAETARLGNVSRAAEILNLTQPALTARLQGLEGDLGVDLFVRGARGVTLTDAGRALLPYAQRVLAQVVEGRKAVQRAARTRSLGAERCGSRSSARTG